MMSDPIKRKPNRAKARLQKRAENMESQRQEAALEAASMPDLKGQESTQLLEKLKTMDLEEHNIKADGHCLYSAFADQIPDETYLTLRRRTAEYIRAHQEQFEPFMMNEDVSVAAYADQIEQTPRWGGEMEIIALARSLKVKVELIQAQGPMLRFEEQNEKVIRLARYEHMYSLGAHFNSLRSRSK